MKLKAVLVLLTLCYNIALPPSLVLISHSGGQAAIVTLDICHSATSALSSTGEMPCVNECTFTALPLQQNMTLELSTVTRKPFFIAFQDERPPKS
jgi:hypothetical protein